MILLYVLEALEATAERVDVLYEELARRGVLPVGEDGRPLDPIFRDLVQLPSGDWVEGSSLTAA